MVAQCLISFGSNLGDRHALVAEAARQIAGRSQVHGFRASRLFETPPIGGPTGQEPFLNAVAAFETNASARTILEMLQSEEERLGRERQHRWGARSIDLDVVLHGELVGGGTGLIVPHPRYTARQFVLRPACDVAPDYRDPRFGWTIQRLAQHLDQGVPSLALVGGDESARGQLCRLLESEFGIQTFAARPLCEPMTVVGNAPAARAFRSTSQRASAGESTQSSGVDGGTPESDTPESGAPVVREVRVEQTVTEQTVTLNSRQPWVSAFVPPLPSLDSDDTSLDSVPRLVARMQFATSQTRWPAPHQMWPAGWRWPEYRLEIDDIRWAASEVASALTSMRCPVEPVSDDGGWW